MTGAGTWSSSRPRVSATSGNTRSRFRYSDALTTCDNHTIYKDRCQGGSRTQAGMALSFMAKYDEARGATPATSTSRCVHPRHGAVFAGDGEHGFSPMFASFVAGPAGLPARAHVTCFAPNINSYKRYAEGSFAPHRPSRGAWDNRTCSLRVVGHGPGLRVENRVPGGDMNPYLGVAALIAAGLHGIEETSLELGPQLEGQRLHLRRPRAWPSTLREAAGLFARVPRWAVDAFGAGGRGALHQRGTGGAEGLRRRPSRNWERGSVGFERL